VADLSSAPHRYQEAVRKAASLAALVALGEIQAESDDADLVVDLPGSDDVCIKVVVALTSNPSVDREVLLPVRASPRGMAARLRVIVKSLRRRQHEAFREAQKAR
jgi:hypothetical protein